jgi:hypothetical protein
VYAFQNKWFATSSDHQLICQLFALGLRRVCAEQRVGNVTKNRTVSIDPRNTDSVLAVRTPKIVLVPFRIKHDNALHLDGRCDCQKVQNAKVALD